jgi:hypothetical protein
MDERPLDLVVRNIDARLERVEQMLPTLPTRTEMHEAIAQAVAPLATKAELREEGERTRRHFDIVAEQMRDDLRLVLDAYQSRS